MTHKQSIAPLPCTDKPKAMGFVRTDVSKLHAPRHASEIRRHARTLGYRYVYTVHPPGDEPDPIGYVLAMAAGLGVEAIVVFELAHVNDQPALICDHGYDLETVCPQSTWTRTALSVPGTETGAAC
ncbi:hypothetical protein AB0L63_01290 [Nocardia sp. NPDC051990]|uniref:hypothetical protein n=1 Tax=Nocardia sp. NPDC051990 TaxID=3155285 RepID=UPI0034241BDC